MKPNRLQLALACIGMACATVAHAPTIDTPAPQPVAGTYLFGNTVDIGAFDEANIVPAFRRFVGLALSGQKAITLRIDSFGGSIFLGARFIRELEDLKKREALTIACIVDGAAYSMAAVLLESPVCDVRLATKRSTVLFHNGSSGARGTAEDLKQAAEFLEALNEAMALMIADRLGVSVSDYRARIAHADWVMSVIGALKANVIDGLVAPEAIEPPPLES